jgi:hypothetical protein
MTQAESAQLEERIGDWRSYVRRRQTIDARDIAELEDHLRSQVADLRQAGLDDDEAFLIGVKRIGALDTLSRAFAREHSERLWKRLVVADTEEGRTDSTREALMAIALAAAAATAIKVPELFGLSFGGTESDQLFYARNVSLFVLPFLAMNLIPFAPSGHTMVLATMHLPMALWLAVGIAYTGGAWRNHDHRMHYVRFSGE